MNITVRTQILDGNLGDGWRDNYSAAKALAEFTEKIWRDDLHEYSDDDIEINIDVERNTSGCSRSVEVFVEDCPNGIDDYDEEQKIASVLTDENTIWEKFLDNNEAKHHYDEN